MGRSTSASAASRSPRRRQRIEALQPLAEFTRSYREALASWQAGLRDVVFPAGTWLMRVQHAVPCAARS